MQTIINYEIGPIDVENTFRKPTYNKGEKLHGSGRVFDVSENIKFEGNRSFITAKVIPQTNVYAIAYAVEIELSK